jgi:hypothetical protein
VNYLIKVRLEWANFNGYPPDADPPYFTAAIPKKYIKVLPNDWPYRSRIFKMSYLRNYLLIICEVPTHIEHYVVWTQLPVIHDDLVHPSIRDRVDHDGLYGFTGQEQPKIESSDPNKELLKQSGKHVQAFVEKTWPESLWECAWFVNPPVSIAFRKA